MAMMLRLMGAKSVVITGVREGSYYTNVVLERGQMEAKFIRTRSSGGERPGTGDVFSSVVAGALLNGKSLPEAVAQAAGFVKECIKVSDEEQIPHANGVCFEKILGKLNKKVREIPFLFSKKYDIFLPKRVLRRKAVRYRRTCIRKTPGPRTAPDLIKPEERKFTRRFRRSTGNEQA